MNQGSWMPVVFMALMGLAMLLYVILDGFDLGIGMLMHRASPMQRDAMIASIGPFWDANETWLVLGVGLLLVAFPKAHGVVLSALYLPVALMLLGLTLRGVAFDFRVKARDQHKPLWNRAFIAGSALASLAQGWMLGRYITGFAADGYSQAFALVIALALPAAYVLLGACWLILKTEGKLQQLAVHWARIAWPPVVVGMGVISLTTPWVSLAVRQRWFTLPDFIGLLPIPLVTLGALLFARIMLSRPRVRTDLCWVPFFSVVVVFLMGGIGLAFSLYPYVVMNRMTIWQAASAPKSLAFILVGVAVTIPAILGYTVFAYRVFWGKAKPLSYG
jgi:cytochrome bd ubiquinol oxidase subunit II